MDIQYITGLEIKHAISLKRSEVSRLVLYLLAPPVGTGEETTELAGILTMLIVADTVPEEQDNSQQN